MLGGIAITQPTRVKINATAMNATMQQILKNLKKCHLALPTQCLFMRMHQSVIDLVLRSFKTVKLCAPHLKNSFSACAPDDAAEQECKSNTRAHLLKRMQEIRLQQRSGGASMKWTLIEKCDADLAHTLAYAVLQCHREYQLIVIPIAVSSSSCRDHANMIMVDMRKCKCCGHAGHTPRTCKLQKAGGPCVTEERAKGIVGGAFPVILFEPNGESFTRKTRLGCRGQPGSLAASLASAVRDANTCLSALGLCPLAQRLTVAGGKGIQTALGMSTERGSAGFGICGAIAYWMFYTWLRNLTAAADRRVYDQVADYQKFIEDRLYQQSDRPEEVHRCAEERARMKIRVKTFITRVGTRQVRYFASTVRRRYFEDLQAYVLNCPHLRGIFDDHARTTFRGMLAWDIHLTPDDRSLTQFDVRIPFRVKLESRPAKGSYTHTLCYSVADSDQLHCVPR